MDSKAQADLKKSLAWIKQGKVEQARAVLAGLLRIDPKNAQAWYLLSYAVDNPERQLFALRQALRSDPSFTRASQRLLKLSGQPAAPEPSSPAAQTQEIPAWARPPENQAASEIQQPEPAEAHFQEIPAWARPPEASSTPEQPPEESSARAELFPSEPSAGEVGDVRAGFLVPEAAAAEKPKSKVPALIGYALLTFVLLFAGLAAMRLYIPPAAVARQTPTSVSSATMPATFTPTVGATATLQPTATAEAQVLAVGADTLAEMQTLQQQVIAVRGLEGGEEVTNVLVPESSAAVVLAEAFFNEGIAEQIEAEEQVLRAFGLLSSSDYLFDYQLNSYADPLGGFYIDSEKSIYLVGESFSGVLPYSYARVFSQALLDQNFPSIQIAQAGCTIVSDACRALRAVVKGDAMLAGQQWLQANPNEPLAAALQNQEADPMLFQGQEPPEFVLRDLAFPVEQGLAFVQTLFAEGGWERVNALYSQAPASSEQILHPEKFLAGEAPLAINDTAFASVLGSGWQPLGSSSLGEWLTYLMLTSGAQPEARLSESAAAAAAAGWGGDLFQAYGRGLDGAVALAAHWVMDSEADATQLAAALAQHLGLRFTQAAGPVGGGTCWAGEGQRSCLYVSGTEVLWLLGPDEIVVIQVMLSHYPQFQ